MQSLISVIIPIYNVAPYLRACLESVITQSYPHLQIILINDGSEDESEIIAKEYLKDPRVELLNTENGGLSKARNIGMSQARGEYIYFIDSDDYLHPDFLLEMIHIAQTYEVEFVCNDAIMRFGLGKEEKIDQKPPQVIIPNSQSIILGGAVWRCLFKTSLIQRVGVKFLEGKIYEDEGFLYMILPYVSKFVRYCGLPYYYRQRERSIMDCYKQIRSEDLLDIFEAIYLFYQKRGLLEHFAPPYYFLYACGIGYKNQNQYLQKAKTLAKKLKLPPSCAKDPIDPIFYAFLHLNVRIFPYIFRLKRIYYRLYSVLRKIQCLYKKI